MNTSLTADIKETALSAGADLVGIADISRFDTAPDDVHPRGVFSGTRSVIAVACRMIRGALKTIEEGNYWQAYNCDSYQYINEVLAPHMLRKIVLFLEDRGFTAVPIHNPFGFRQGRPVRPGGRCVPWSRKGKPGYCFRSSSYSRGAEIQYPWPSSSRPPSVCS